MFLVDLKDTVLTESAGDVSNAAEPVVDLTYEDEEIPVSVSEMSTPVTTDETTNTTLASKTTVLDHDQSKKIIIFYFILLYEVLS